MQLEKGTLEILPAALRALEEGFASLPAIDTPAPGQERMAEVMQQVAVRLRDNYPYFHPLYAGQMLKPPHPIARAAYALATWINPNNHALDGGRASSAMEKEAVAEIAAMFGWQTHLGHLSSGGTMANLEALWVAGQLHPGKKIAASAQAHYTHHRISSVLGLPFAELPCDPRGRMDTQALAERLAEGRHRLCRSHPGNHWDGLRRSLAGDPSPARPTRLPLARRRGVRRLLHPRRKSDGGNPRGVRPDRPSRLDCR